MTDSREPSSSPQPRRDEIDLAPKPRLRRITQQQVLVVFLLALFGLVYLSFRYAHRSLAPLGDESTPGPSAPALDPERIRAIGREAVARRQREAALREQAEALDELLAGRPAPPAPVSASPGPGRPPVRDTTPRRLAASLGSGSRRQSGAVGGASRAGLSLQPLETALGRIADATDTGSPSAADLSPPASLAGSSALEAQLAPPGRWVLASGTVIPGVLTHRLDTAEPGLVRAQVTRDVFDSADARAVLIPRGTLAYGTQARIPRLGDERVVVAWSSLRYPDGRTLLLPGAPAISPDGSLGVRGRVRERWGQRFGAAVLLSLVGAGVQLSQPQRSASFGEAASAGQVAAGELGLETGRLAGDILERTVDLPPEIHLPPGARVGILLTRDLVFEAPPFGGA